MDKELTNAGFDIAKLNENQKYLIMLPSYAPENYHHDGEVTPTQAMTIWKRNMAQAGLDQTTINKAVKLHFKR